jgi:hypothetical protein
MRGALMAAKTPTPPATARAIIDVIPVVRLVKSAALMLLPFLKVAI